MLIDGSTVDRWHHSLSSACLINNPSHHWHSSERAREKAGTAIGHSRHPARVRYPHLTRCCTSRH